MKSYTGGGFQHFPDLGQLGFRKLLTNFGSEKDLLASLGVLLTTRFIIFRKTFSFETYAKKLSDKKISFLSMEGKNYAHFLAKIPNALVILYCKVNVDLLSG